MTETTGPADGASDPFGSAGDDGLVADRGMETIVYALHKPVRMECIRAEVPRAPPTAKQVELKRRNCLTRWLMELEAIEGCSLHSIGRLDKDTSGLLLVTNDGKFTSLLLRPGFCSKVYIADCTGIPDSGKLAKLQDGSIEISNKQNKKDKRVRRDENGCYEMLSVKCEGVQVMATWVKSHKEFQTHFCRLRMEMRTGQFRVVRRMLGAIGLGVKKLHRESIGKLVLRSTPPPIMSENMSEISGDYESGSYFKADASGEQIILDIEQSSHVKLSKEVVQCLKENMPPYGDESCATEFMNDDNGYCRQGDCEGSIGSICGSRNRSRSSSRSRSRNRSRSRSR